MYNRILSIYFSLTLKATFDYLPSGPQEEAWGLQVSAFGQGRIAPHESYPRSGHPSDHDFSWNEGRVLSSLQVILISRGKGTFEANPSGPQAVRAGDCLLIQPGVWHRYRPDRQTGWTEHWLELRGRLVEEWLRAGVLETPGALIRPRAMPAVLAEFESFHMAATRMEPGYRPVIAAKALAILTRLVADVPLASPDEYRSNLQAAHRLLRESMAEKLSMREIARQLSMSYPTFHRQFRAETGLSPKQYADQMRLAHAQQLLSSTNLSLKEIAGRLRYHSAFHFSRQFKSRFGVSPSTYRTQQG